MALLSPISSFLTLTFAFILEGDPAARRLGSFFRSPRHDPFAATLHRGSATAQPLAPHHRDLRLTRRTVRQTLPAVARTARTGAPPRLRRASVGARPGQRRAPA